MTARTDIDLKAMKIALETERDEIAAASSAGADGRKPVELDQQAVGRLSRMDALQVQAMSKAQEGRRQGRVAVIAAALKRMVEDEYGYCVECGDDIPVKRLEIDPASARCIDCMG
jgi:DnaK suppressor protein